ncbi:DNRLRE domain-containing protein [Paenibacillus thiaminolyticus]|uniref:CBM96 family carbohydrate-binding protein n=1 Tax=Paenibacillus thiaminolyticus TaxID=49283 RepID=UPI00232EA7F2|nr:DNRLRE domain-containing protein [Paenibacillus thiaminolyticus]WCF10744.1 DNRLRE domain-containing protein [Paenibacillus thiaminolyticus]
MVSTTDNTAGVFRLGTEQLTEALQQSGYRTVFDIASENLAEFQKNNPEIPSSDAKEIYQLAVQRTENLCMLNKAWQLHNDPVVQSLPKLSADTGLRGMRAALERSLGGGSDFGDLFPERSPEGYAEASSIQSLFSPGRYLTMLYKIARDLHDPKDKLHIDNRRPDLKSLILNTDNMNREVSSLDILLDVLQPEGSGTLASLKDTYYPMNLPYDDDLAQINAVAEARSSNLLGIWDTLLDTQRTSILQDSAAIRRISKTRQSAYANQKASDDEPVLITREEFFLETGGVADTTPSPPTREMLSLTPNSFRLLVNPEPTAEDIAKHYNVTTTLTAELAAVLQVVDDFCLKTGLSFNELLDLTMQKDDESIGSEYKSRFVKFGGEANVPVSTYGAVFLTGTEETPLWVGKGAVISPAADAYVRNGTYANTNYGSDNSLVVKQDGSSGYSREAYIRFDLTGLSGAVEEAKISLTTIAKQLSSLSHQAHLVSDNSWDELKITWNNKPAGGAIIASWDVPEVGGNVKVDVTRQVNDALANGQDKLSIVIRSNANYGSLGDVSYASREHPEKASRPSMEIKAITGAGLNFTADNVVALAGRAEKLVRLARSTGLSFEQLDWLIANASRAVMEHGGELILDKPVLEAVAEFTRLNKRYGVTSDMFAAFIGEVNTYAEAGKDSFYQTIFSTADHMAALPLGATLQFEVSKQDRYESICCGAMGVTADEFSRIGKYCFGDNVQQVIANETTVAQLYRLGRIPHMLGLRFTEAELLWKLMDGGEDILLRTIGANPRSLEALEIIRRTEVLLDWMDAHQLDVVSLQAMVTNRYSDTATPELYNFLAQVHQSTSRAANVSRADAEDTLPTDKLFRALAAGFNLKANVMAQVIDWLDKTDGAFTLRAFWDKLQAYFSADHEEELTALEGEAALLQWCQQLSQYALIVRWSGLSEQDLALLTEHPGQLLAGQHTVPVPSLHLLLVLTRLKEWQQRVQVSSEEAMRYFAQADAPTVTRDAAVKRLARIHGWNEQDTASMNDYLLGENEYPKNFEQIFALESWVNLGRQLNVGSRTLGELVDMSEEDDTAENMDLIISVAQSLMAAAQA